MMKGAEEGNGENKFPRDFLPGLVGDWLTYPRVHDGVEVKADEEQGSAHGVTHVADLRGAARFLHVAEHRRHVIAGNLTPAAADHIRYFTEE